VAVWVAIVRAAVAWIGIRIGKMYQEEGAVPAAGAVPGAGTIS
jgi:hypothetical protein